MNRALDSSPYLLDIKQSLSPVLEILGRIVPFLPLLGRHLLIVQSLYASIDGVEEAASDFQIPVEVEGVWQIRLGKLLLLLFLIFPCERGEDIVKIGLDCNAQRNVRVVDEGEPV